jgi:hypothetical protein
MEADKSGAGALDIKPDLHCPLSHRKYEDGRYFP